jgi:hypothetical protein
MSEFSEDSGADQVVYVFDTPELDECNDGQATSNNEHSETSPSNEFGKTDLVRILGTEIEPGYPEDEHRCQDEDEDRLALKVYLVSLFEKLVHRADNEAQKEERRWN